MYLHVMYIYIYPIYNIHINIYNIYNIHSIPPESFFFFTPDKKRGLKRQGWALRLGVPGPSSQSSPSNPADVFCALATPGSPGKSAPWADGPMSDVAS